MSVVHGNYITPTGKVHKFKGKKDWLNCLVYECGLRLPSPPSCDKLTTKAVTCKKCGKK